MKKSFILIIIVQLFSCSSIIKENLTIEKVNLKINMNNQENDAVYHHIMLENIGFKEKSVHYYYYDIKDVLDFSLSYGTYNIYYFGLSAKTETSMNVSSYSYIKNITVNKDKEVFLEIKKLKPVYSFDIENNSGSIIIDMNDISDFFSLSSASVKQGSDRYRSAAFEYDYDRKVYIIEIPVQYYGNWFMNISYSVKYKFNNSISSNESISLSTSYFSDNFLGAVLQ